MSFVPVLVIIWFCIYIDLLIQDRKDRYRIKLFVILTIRPLKESCNLDLYFYFTVSTKFFSPQSHHFPNRIKSLSLFLCSNLVHQTVTPDSIIQQLKILITAPNFVTLPSSYLFTKVLMLVKTLKFDQILKVSG